MLGRAFIMLMHVMSAPSIFLVTLMDMGTNGKSFIENYKINGCLDELSRDFDGGE